MKPNYNPFLDYLKWSEIKPMFKDFMLYIGVGITAFNEAMEYIGTQIKNGDKIDWNYIIRKTITKGVLNTLVTIGFTALGNALGALFACTFGLPAVAGALAGVLIGTVLSIFCGEKVGELVNIASEFLIGFFKELEGLFFRKFSVDLI